MDKFLKGFGFVVFYAVTLVVNGFIIKQMWLWFIVPLGVSQIGIAHAVGIDVIFTYMKGIKKDKDVGWELVLEKITHAIVSMLFLYLLAFVAHMFM